MRYIRIFFCPFTWQQPSIVIINSIHDRNYTQPLASSFWRSKITQEMFYGIRRHEQQKRMLLTQPRWIIRWNNHQTRTCRFYHLRPCWASNWNRQLQSRESNWLWHENRIIIIHPLYQNRFMNMSNICPSNKWNGNTTSPKVRATLLYAFILHRIVGINSENSNNERDFRVENQFIYKHRNCCRRYAIHKSYFQELSIALIECNKARMYHLRLIPNRLCY